MGCAWEVYGLCVLRISKKNKSCISCMPMSGVFLTLRGCDIPLTNTKGSYTKGMVTMHVDGEILKKNAIPEPVIK